MTQWHSALRYNLVSAQIAGLHYLHILVVYVLHSSKRLHRVLNCHQFLDSLMQRIISSTVRGFREKTLSLTTSQKKKSIGVRSGDRGGHPTGPHRPSHLFGNCSSRNLCTVPAWCGGAPSCWKQKSSLSCCLCNCGKTVSLSMLRYRSCVTAVWKK